MKILLVFFLIHRNFNKCRTSNSNFELNTDIQFILIQVLFAHFCRQSDHPQSIFFARVYLRALADLRESLDCSRASSSAPTDQPRDARRELGIELWIRLAAPWHPVSWNSITVTGTRWKLTCARMSVAGPRPSEQRIIMKESTMGY